MKRQTTLRELAEPFFHPGGDSLDLLFEFQRAHQAELGELDVDPIEGIRRNVLRTIAELVELLEEFKWRWHRREESEAFDRQRVLEETADCMFFLNAILIHAGVESGRELRDSIGAVCVKNILRLEHGQNRRQT